MIHYKWVILAVMTAIRFFACREDLKGSGYGNLTEAAGRKA